MNRTALSSLCSFAARAGLLAGQFCYTFFYCFYYTFWAAQNPVSQMD